VEPCEPLVLWAAPFTNLLKPAQLNLFHVFLCSNTHVSMSIYLCICLIFYAFQETNLLKPSEIRKRLSGHFSWIASPTGAGSCLPLHLHSIIIFFLCPLYSSSVHLISLPGASHIPNSGLSYLLLPLPAESFPSLFFHQLFPGLASI
jgi:hypothetical protein